MARRARVVYRPLTDWPYPPTPQRPTPFATPWPVTVDMLTREADHLNAKLVVIELDVPDRAIRKDQQLRSDARAASEKVRISMDTHHGALAWHCRTFRLPAYGQLGWRQNVHAIVKTLEMLRAIDRYGAVSGAEQYRGFAAIEAPAAAFATADEALRWVREQAGNPAETLLGRALFLRAARRLHPDVGGDPADWALLDQARQLIEAGRLW